MNADQKSRLRLCYYLKTIEKKTCLEIAEQLGISDRTVKRALSRFRKANHITNQTADDLITFYENEIQLLNERRNRPDVSHRIFQGYSKIITDLQDKIAELLKLKDAATINNIREQKHFHLTVNRPTEGVHERTQSLAETRRSDFLEGS